MDPGAQAGWITSYEGSIAPIVNYYIKFYNISQNTTGVDQPGNVYVYQDNNANCFINGTNFANVTFTGNINSFNQTQVVGKNLFQANVVNTSSVGAFKMSWLSNAVAYSGVGLVLRIPFEQSVTDVVGDAYINQGNNAVTYTTGKVGYCANFSGNTGQSTPYQWYWLSNPIDQLPYSISMWFQLQSTPWYGGVLALGDGKGNSVLSCDVLSNCLVFSSNSLTSNLSTPALTIGTWYHICLTVDSLFVHTLYLNGLPYTRVTGTGTYKFNTNVVYLGGNANGVGLRPSRGFNGYIDEFCIHSGALNQYQVTSLSNLTPYYNSAQSLWYTDAECQWNYYTWSDTITLYYYGGTVGTTQGTKPDVQWQLGFNTGSTLNNISYLQRIQDYSSFTLYFEIYIGNTSAADGGFVFFGQNTGAIGEGGGAGGWCVDFQIYTGGGRARGIYLFDKTGVQRAFYSTGGFVANAWQPCYLYYNKSTTNTISFTWNGTSVFTYSDPSEDSWISTSGPQWGFGFRDGGSKGSCYFRHVQLFHQ